MNRLLSKDKPFYIMSHRGFWGGNIIQNTRQAAEVAHLAGADIVEVDICRSSDGKYYLFHDGNEPIVLGTDINFNHLSSYEIEGRDALNAAGENSGIKVEQFGSFLAWLPENYLVNLDRTWFYWNDPTFFNLLVQSQKMNQLLLKSPVETDLLERLNDVSLSIPYVAIVKSVDDINLVLDYENINYVGVELIVDEVENHLLLAPSTLNYIEDLGLIKIINCEDLGQNHELFGDLNDTNALIGVGEEIWEKILSYNIDVIQTDWPNFLNDYRRKIM